jgi:hypothetical protein
MKERKINKEKDGVKGNKLTEKNNNNKEMVIEKRK